MRVSNGCATEPWTGISRTTERACCFRVGTSLARALGVSLPAYRGYRAAVNPGLSNEFATVGYRAHSMIHGQFDVPFGPGRYSAAQLRTFRAEGIGLGAEDGAQSLQIPLTVAFGNP